MDEIISYIKSFDTNDPAYEKALRACLEELIHEHVTDEKIKHEELLQDIRQDVVDLKEAHIQHVKTLRDFHKRHINFLLKELEG